jgi:hypothetical protein
MPTIAAYCEECGDSFYLRDEMYYPSGKKTFRVSKPKKELRTWEDWLMHISSHCEKCRLQTVPEKCEQDYNKLKGG